jgi:hypothetical protein
MEPLRGSCFFFWNVYTSDDGTAPRFMFFFWNVYTSDDGTALRFFFMIIIRVNKPRSGSIIISKG